MKKTAKRPESKLLAIGIQLKKRESELAMAEVQNKKLYLNLKRKESRLNNLIRDLNSQEKASQNELVKIDRDVAAAAKIEKEASVMRRCMS